MWAGSEKPGLAAFLLVAAQAGVPAAQAQAPVAADTAAIEARLERVENVLSNQGLLEMVQQLQALEVEINRLRGELEVQNHALEQLKKRQRDLYTDMDRRMQRFESPVAAQSAEPFGDAAPPLQTLTPFDRTEEAGAGSPAETPLTLELVGPAPATATPEEEAVVPLTASPAPAAVAGSEPTPDSEPAPLPAGPASSEAPEDIAADTLAHLDPGRVEADYQRAFNLLKQSLYERAITAFREFLVSYPGSEYADDARFWLAEAHYVNSRFDQALAEYNALAQQYPDSPKLPQTRLKAAFCQHELGRIEPAKQQLEEIIQQYPGTTAANLAQERLARIATDAAPAASDPPEPL